jgi:N-acetylneuraminic acid mutarotase
MPEKLTHSGSAVDNAFIYFAGGYVGEVQVQPAAVTRHVWRYDTVTDDWQAMLSLPAARSAGALVRVGRKLHFFGGVDSRRRDTADHWVLDLRRPTKWVTDTAMPNPRNHLGAIETGGKIYAIGGQHRGDENTGNEAGVDAFDVVTGVWSAVASLPLVLSHVHNSTFLSGGKVTVAGGSTAGVTPSSDVLQYDPATNTWKEIGDLPTALSAPTVDLLGGHIIVTGGRTSAGVPTDDSWINV